jgi:hypothetical protein
MTKILIGFIVAAAMLSAQTPPPHSVTLNWLDNQAGATYSVYRATGLCSGTPVFAKIVTALTVKTFVDTTVTPGNYCYTATATVNGMESAQAVPVVAAVPTSPPTGLTATPIV